MKKLFSTIFICCAINSFFGQTIFKDYVDGQIYVKFQPWALKEVSRDNPNNIPVQKFAGLSKILSKYGVVKAFKPFYQANDDGKLPYILKFNFSQKNQVNDFVKEISNVYGVEYAEKVPLMSTYTVAPNDPSYASQPHLPQINAPGAWSVFNGNSNITVAVVDNAIMYTHADLSANIYINPIEAGGTAGVDDDGNGYVDDINGYDVGDGDNNPAPTNMAMDHGTHCSGIAGGRTNNGVGIASIGWNIKIIPVKCTPDTGNPSSIYNGYGGIVYAAKAKARVISCSWGGGAYSAAEQSVIDYAWNKGCILVIAAGNANTNTPGYPGAYNHSYCVASVGTPSAGVNNVKSSFSNYGQPGNAWVDIAAPGEMILSTVPNGGYVQYSGTSMATPMVAGLCGLMLSKCSYMTQQDVLNCISTTAANIYTIAGNATYSTGLQLGAGRIDALAAMNCAAGFLLSPPIAHFYTLTKNTCPNTPILFQDSSLYAPTSWNWTFAGGTPSTSTLSSPTIQWATPGVYSATLVASNANGTSTYTKTNYITISTPTTLPLNEGFQAATFLPTNWTTYNIGNDNVYWQRATTCGGFGTSTASALFDNASNDAGGDRDEMRTPRYNFSNVASAHLRFDVAYQFLDPTDSDSLQVKLSTNCGTSWNSIYFKGGTLLATAPGTQFALFVPTSAQWRRDTIDVTALTAGQPNVMMSFVNHGHYGQGIYLDNINLFFPAPTANFNTPPPVCPGVSVTFTNTTTGAANYTWSFPGGSPATSTLTNPTITYSAGGVYNASLTAQNGTTTIVVTKTLAINPTPTIAVNNQTICSGGQATITASGAGTYSWSNGFVGNPLLVSPASNTVYTVTGNLAGCINTKTVSVTIGTMLAVYITPSQPTVCAAGASTLSASGAVNYTWSGGSNSVNIVVTPTTTTTYSIIGNNGACSGTTAITISVVPVPTINISANPSFSICMGNTATLTANGAYSAYTWVTPTVNAVSITVGPTVNTTYTVTGTAAGGCTTSSTVAVYIKALPLTVMSMTDASCMGCGDGAAQVVASGGIPPYSYQWLPVGGTGSVAVGFNPGCYSVNVTGGGCTVQDTICVGLASATGIKTINSNLNSLLIFPNPAHDFIIVECPGSSFDFALFNNLGQVIIQKSNNQKMAYIQFNELAKGVYTIVIEQANEKVRKKLIID